MPQQTTAHRRMSACQPAPPSTPPPEPQPIDRTFSTLLSDFSGQNKSASDLQALAQKSRVVQEPPPNGLQALGHVGWREDQAPPKSPASSINGKGKGKGGKPAEKDDRCVQRENRAYAKTKMCVHFLGGRCKKFDKCPFAHYAYELQERPDMSRTSMCPRGAKCTKPGCTYAHTRAELRATGDMYKTSMCKFYKGPNNNNCKAGEFCRHAHGAHELRPMPQTPPPRCLPVPESPMTAQNQHTPSTGRHFGSTPTNTAGSFTQAPTPATKGKGKGKGKSSSANNATTNEDDQELDKIVEYVLAELKTYQGKPQQDGIHYFPMNPSVITISRVCHFALEFFREPSEHVKNHLKGEYATAIMSVLSDGSLYTRSQNLSHHKISMVLVALHTVNMEVMQQNQQQIPTMLPGQAFSGQAFAPMPFNMGFQAPNALPKSMRPPGLMRTMSMMSDMSTGVTYMPMVKNADGSMTPLVNMNIPQADDSSRSKGSKGSVVFPQNAANGSFIPQISTPTALARGNSGIFAPLMFNQGGQPIDMQGFRKGIISFKFTARRCITFFHQMIL